MGLLDVLVLMVGVCVFNFCLLFHYAKWNNTERYAQDVGLGWLYKIKTSKRRNASSRTFYSEGPGPEVCVIVIARARRERCK